MFPFEQGAMEMVLIGALALIVLGPKDLPIVMRRVGQFIGKMRGMAAEFRASFDELARQSELEDLRKEVEALRRGELTAPPIGGEPVADYTPFANAAPEVESHGFSFPPQPHVQPVVEAVAAPDAAEPADVAPAKPVRKSRAKPTASTVESADVDPPAKPRRTRAKPKEDALAEDLGPKDAA